MNSRPDLYLSWASHAAAKFACERWHYSESIPVHPLVKIGAWEDKKFIGVIIFSRGASSNLLKPYGLGRYEGCELTRVALNSHKTPVTRIIRIALKLLRGANPKLRLVVSFADPSRGHHGGVYKGGGWIYSGETAGSTEYRFGNRKLHSRQVSEKGWNIQQGKKRMVPKPSQCRQIKMPGKHRYLMPLDDQMRLRLAPLSKPYPKRDKQAMVGSNQHSGGAAPTVTLQH